MTEDTSEYIRAADDALETAYLEPMTLEEYVETLFETPSIGSHASKYILEAIESMGTRTVIEEGEQKERYCFFDDPHNGGEHAIFGNTEVLNSFVDDLRSIAAKRGKDEKILWLEGPTATGKSEFKRCMINGLRAYSQTESGRRFTLEWNISASGKNSSLSYGSGETHHPDEWYESPVQTHPLSVFPADVRADLVAELNDQDMTVIDTVVDEGLDPFSQEAYDFLETEYREDGVSDLFSAVTDVKHLRVKNYIVDVGSGIGVLHSEDDGSPKERLVGTWMAGMLQELDSRGRKNPQAFSYDGVLSQGNGVLTVVEDAAQHGDLLRKLLNVPDEGHVKLDKGIGMDIDTQMVIISNPDLELQLNKHADKNGSDPLKALKRRLDKHKFTYLTNLSLEAQLLIRELTDKCGIWTVDEYTELAEKYRQALFVDVQRSSGEIVTREIAPHSIEAAALYSVVSRLDLGVLPNELDVVEKALLFDRGYIYRGDDRLEKSDFDFNGDTSDGETGIPVTYTRDIIASLLHEDTDRAHPELDVERVVMPNDFLDALVDGLEDAPVFSDAEVREFTERISSVSTYILEQQEKDVLEAMLSDQYVDESTIEAYIDTVYAWGTDETVTDSQGNEVPPDPIEMKVFEVERLGRFSDEDYNGSEPTDAVAEFREQSIITAANRHAWQSREDGFTASDMNLHELSAIQDVLGSYRWEDVHRLFPDFDASQWTNPPAGTETETLKEITIEALCDQFGYSRESAELVSQRVLNQVSSQWD